MKHSFTFLDKIKKWHKWRRYFSCCFSYGISKYHAKNRNTTDEIGNFWKRQKFTKIHLNIKIDGKEAPVSTMEEGEEAPLPPGGGFSEQESILHVGTHAMHYCLRKILTIARNW